MTRLTRMETIYSVTLAVIVVACSGADSNSSSSGGANGAGGSAGAAGASSGGANSPTGGATAGGAGTGGVVAMGGSSLGAGGSANTGGTKSTGGTSTAGGASATGGTKSTGGTSTAGGSANTGGTKSTGGSQATGGTTSRGGSSNTGGSKSTGGTSGAGGASTTGGASSTGGTGGKPYRGVANSPCAARTNLGVSWYYNWEQTADAPCSSPSVGGEFVPMIWGHTGAEQSASGITSAIASMVSRGNTTVLGFNEPDNTGQSNLSVATAISLWPAFNNPSIQIGSPATQANTTGVAWFTDFNTQVNANTSLRVDFIAIHWYGWNAGSCDANASTLAAYIRQIEALPGNRPMWLTEWGCLNGSDNGSEATTQAHIAGAVAMFAQHPRLERYAWYPWADSAHALNNSDGSLTTLGQFYASLPAYK